jgi:hypothetical protein
LCTARLSPVASPDAAAELEKVNIEEEGARLSLVDKKFMPPFDSGADGDCGDGTVVAAATTSCRCP